MKTQATVRIMRPEASDHDHYAKLYFDQATRIGHRIDAALDLLQPVAAAVPEQLDATAIKAVFDARLGLLAARSILDELRDRLALCLTPYDHSGSVGDAIDHYGGVNDSLWDEERRKDMADELLHGTLDAEDW